jgi:hypothetical protein
MNASNTAATGPRCLEYSKLHVMEAPSDSVTRRIIPLTDKQPITPGIVMIVVAR